MNTTVLNHLLTAIMQLLSQRSTQAGLATLLVSIFPHALPATISADFGGIIQIIGGLLVLFPESAVVAPAVTISDPKA